MLPIAPFDALDDATAALLDLLERCGLGRWEIVEGSVVDLRDEEELLVPIVVPSGPRLYSLRPVQGDADLTRRDIETVEVAAKLVATVLAASARNDEMRERVLRAEQESVTDALTGLPNARAWWRLLSREADRCDRHDLRAVIAVVDLDNLKVTNDTQGHLAGDLLLKNAGQALESAVRSIDWVARLGGDEFGVLAVDSHPPTVEVLTDRLRSALADVDIPASVGGATYGPGQRINDVFHEADLAMYREKRRGGRGETATAISASGTAP